MVVSFAEAITALALEPTVMRPGTMIPGLIDRVPGGPKFARADRP